MVTNDKTQRDTTAQTKLLQSTSRMYNVYVLGYGSRCLVGFVPRDRHNLLAVQSYRPRQTKCKCISFFLTPLVASSKLAKIKWFFDSKTCSTSASDKRYTQFLSQSEHWSSKITIQRVCLCFQVLRPWKLWQQLTQSRLNTLMLLVFDMSSEGIHKWCLCRRLLIRSIHRCRVKQQWLSLKDLAGPVPRLLHPSAPDSRQTGYGSERLVSLPVVPQSRALAAAQHKYASREGSWQGHDDHSVQGSPAEQRKRDEHCGTVPIEHRGQPTPWDIRLCLQDSPPGGKHRHIGAWSLESKYLSEILRTHFSGAFWWRTLGFTNIQQPVSSHHSAIFWEVPPQIATFHSWARWSKDPTYLSSNTAGSNIGCMDTRCPHTAKQWIIMSSPSFQTCFSFQFFPFL